MRCDSIGVTAEEIAATNQIFSPKLNKNIHKKAAENVAFLC